jgi:enterochelin esterase-like enzyme
LNLLLLNDGQEAEAMELESLLDTLYQEQRIEGLMVVAIKTGEERLKEYGVAGFPDYLNRGAAAAAYAQFITSELLPYIKLQARQVINGKTGFAGFSLGGLSAFDIVYNHSDLFDVAGVFSGAFWWRKKGLHDGYQEDQDRILHQMIRNSQAKPEVKFWLMAGTAEETADRNHNCIIDAVDDTTDVIRELVDKGFRRYEDLFYYEMVGGKHDLASWRKAFPAFLTWSFPKRIK